MAHYIIISQHHHRIINSHDLEKLLAHRNAQQQLAVQVGRGPAFCCHKQNRLLETRIDDRKNEIDERWAAQSAQYVWLLSMIFFGLVLTREQQQQQKHSW